MVTTEARESNDSASPGNSNVLADDFNGETLVIAEYDSLITLQDWMRP